MVFVLATILLPRVVFAQQPGVRGTVYENEGGKKIPLKSASIVLNPYGLEVFSDDEGNFVMDVAPTGVVSLTISYVGKATLDTLMERLPTEPLTLVLERISFRLADVEVVAKPSTVTLGSSSIIGRNAIEHLQANSLADVMSLIPGGLTQNPDLTGAKQINIRSVVCSDANAFGTSIIVNGSPLSNNANLQALSPVMSGGAAGMGGGAVPRGGIDTRNVPMYNVESVEVIRGVPGVKYGDLASGAVIVNQRAGRQRLLVETNTNPNVYSVNASKGLVLGENKGALNIGTAYAYNTNDPVQSYRFYQRASVDALYSNRFLANRLSNNTGLAVQFGKDTRKLNPDDEVNRIRSSAAEKRISFYTNGAYQVAATSWLRSIDYSGRLTIAGRESDYQEQYTSATSAYGMTYVDGAVLGNRQGQQIYDEEGRELTDIPIGEEHLYAVYLPSTYLGVHRIEGKEVNAFVSASANFFNGIGSTEHSWMIGGDFRADGNFGPGKMFADSLPPYRNLSYVNSSYRNRSYADIPTLHQVGLFIEDNFVSNVANRTLHVSAGLRYDRFSQRKSVWAPRVNMSFEVLPRKLSIKAGYGVIAKGPSLLYLFPEKAYFDYININEMASEREDAVFMTTTRVFNTENPDLKIATNTKKEIGLEAQLGKSLLSITAFDERLKNSYAIGPTVHSFRPVQYEQYERVAEDEDVFREISSDAVLAKFNMPNNSRRVDKQGIEFQLNLARMNSIRTQFSIHGAYIRQKVYSADYYYYDGQSGAGAGSRTHIGLYEPGMETRYDRSAVTAFKATHNIPKIGLAVTLTADIRWNESDWTVYGNDSIPINYISKIDGQIYAFEENNADEEELKALLRPVARTQEVRESFPPMVNFNINITKEIGDFMRMSFFANNMFRYYQVVQSDRVASRYYKRNDTFPLFFGFKLGVQL